MDFKLYLEKENGAFIYTNRIDWWMELDLISGTVWNMEEIDIDIISKRKSVRVRIDNFNECNYDHIPELCKILSADISNFSVANSCIPNNSVPANIKTLIIGENVKMNLDASQFKELTYFSMLSYKTFKGNITNHFENLVECVIWYYNNKGFGDMKNLLFAKNTKIMQFNLTNIYSFNYIEYFSQLETLKILYGRSLTDISKIYDLPKIKHLLIENSKKINKLWDTDKSICIDHIGLHRCKIVPYFKTDKIKDLMLFQTTMGEK